MPFDANLVLADTTLDWDETNLGSFGVPTDTTRNNGGFVVIDTLALGGLAAKGMVAVFIADETANSSGDALTLIIEGSDNKAFGTGGAGLEALAAFGVEGANGSGVIDGDETPCTIIRLFATNRRYIRCKATCTASDDFHTCQVFLAPWGYVSL